MNKKLPLETAYERFLRTRAEDICRTYLGWSHKIMSGQIKPNRIIQGIAKSKGMSGEGVKQILMRRGLYRSKEQPVVIQQVSVSQPPVGLVQTV